MNYVPDTPARVQTAADRIEAIYDDPELNITLIELVQALALVASRKADRSIVGSAHQYSYNNASENLYSLSQTGRLYRHKEIEA